jgi:hypothetical protein
MAFQAMQIVPMNAIDFAIAFISRLLRILKQYATDRESV